MKLAIFSPISFDPKLGAAKHRIDLANSLTKHGWSTSLLDYTALGLDSGYTAHTNSQEIYRDALKWYLHKHAEKFDVVLYEYDTLPYARSIFAADTLFIASPSLLFYHFLSIKFPLDAKSKIKKWLTPFRPSKYTEYNRKTEYALQQADIIQVQNKLDEAVLQQRGFPSKQIITVPCGLSADRKAQLNLGYRDYSASPCVAFIGTFDLRKGAMDFPKIIERVKEKIPACTFKLLGTKGMLVDAQQVLDFFPKRLWSAISVVPTFSANDLPLLLSGCHIGMFPSYIESFGIGVLEMMAAGLPVVCYKAPGPSDFVPAHLLVDPGDVDGFAAKITQLLTDINGLKACSQEAVAVSDEYVWDKIAASVSDSYKRLSLAKRHVLA